MTTNTNRFRKGMAGLALVGVTALGVGAAGVTAAGAATAAPRTTATTCEAQLHTLRLQQAELEGKIDVLQRERNLAIANGRYELAQQLERTILDLQARLATVHAKIVVLAHRCG
jgi:hypothetical protein